MQKAVMVAVAAAMASAGCESRAEPGPTVQRSYQVGAFDRIEVAGPYEVRVRTGGAPSVSAEGPEKLMERLIVEVKDGRLLIHPRKERGVLNWSSDIRGTATVNISAPALRGASIAGSGGMSVDRISGGSFTGGVAGSGDLSIDSLDVQDLKLSVAGSGDVRAASGRARRGEYSIAGSGDIDARAIRLETADVSIAGSGSINGQATGAADVGIMGSGDVTLTGGARCTVSKVGSGRANCS